MRGSSLVLFFFQPQSLISPSEGPESTAQAQKPGEGGRLHGKSSNIEFGLAGYKPLVLGLCRMSILVHLTITVRSSTQILRPWKASKPPCATINSKCIESVCLIGRIWGRVCIPVL